MRWMPILLFAAWLSAFAACNAGKAGRESTGVFFLLGSEILSMQPGDARANALVAAFSSKVDKLKREAANPAEREMLMLYGRAADSYRLAIQRHRAEAAEVPGQGLVQGSPSSEELWRRAAGRLKEAQTRFAARMGMRKIESPVYMDPPMPKKRKP